MEMMNRLTGNALDSQKFVDAIKDQEQRVQQMLQAEEHVFTHGHENRTQRRARERAEAKAARKAKA